MCTPMAASSQTHHPPGEEEVSFSGVSQVSVSPLLHPQGDWSMAHLALTLRQYTTTAVPCYIKGLLFAATNMPSFPVGVVQFNRVAGDTAGAADTWRGSQGFQLLHG